MINVRQMHK